MEKILNKVNTLWSQATSWQKWAVMAAVAVAIGLTVFFSVRMSGSYVPLFTNLSTQDAASIVKKLEELGVSYRLSGDGTTVLVPEKNVHRLRLEMATENLPTGGVVGFESFSQTRLGATAFERNVQYVQALQGELTRTIMSLDEIDFARVHIVVPEQSLFSDKNEPASASIMLRLKPGAKLSPQRVQGIVRLVASSVENLSEEHVTIIDSAGNILNGDRTFESIAETHVAAQKAVESYLQGKLMELIGPIVGYNRVRVQVTALINFDSFSQRQEIFMPEANGLGVIRSHQTQEQTSSILPPAEGSVGVIANVGDEIDTYQAVTPYNRTTHSKNEITNYEISRRIEEYAKTPGTVENIFVAIALDGTEESIPDAQVAAIERLAASAIGINEARGDRLVVTRAPFNRETEAKLQEALAQLELQALEKKQAIQRTALIVGIATLVLGLTILLIARWRKARSQRIDIRVDENTTESDQETGQLGETDIEGMLQERVNIRERIKTAIQSNPQTVAKIIENWLVSDE